MLYSQRSTNWINVNDLLTFVDISDTQIVFIWASEECGFRHLYLITSSLVRAMNGVKDPVSVEYVEGINLVARINNKVRWYYYLFQELLFFL